MVFRSFVGASDATSPSMSALSPSKFDRTCIILSLPLTWRMIFVELDDDDEEDVTETTGPFPQRDRHPPSRICTEAFDGVVNACRP